jgi:hypothetical protein
VARRQPLHQQRDNDLRLGRLDSSSDGLRENTTAERPLFTSPHMGREPAIKAKEPEARSVGGADGLVGGGNRFGKGKPHLWRPPPQHRRQRPPAHQHRTARTAAALKRTGRSSLPSSPQKRERDRPRTRVPPSWRTTCCATLRCGRRRKEDQDEAGPCTTRPTPVWRTGGHAPFQRKEVAPEAAPEPLRPGSRTHSGCQRHRRQAPFSPDH